MVRQGLLFKDAPEARFELYCNHSLGKKGGGGTCNILFDTISDFNKHNDEVHEYGWFKIRELPIRPKRRFHTNQLELDNLKNKKCWCGKSKSNYNGKYCSKEHYKDWWDRADNTAFHRNKFLRSKPRVCEMCDIKTNYREMDHIIAVVLGGHPWDYRNLQAICETCHKAKTKSDMGILAWWKRQARYDAGI